jgi:hypothetical protein
MKRTSALLFSLAALAAGCGSLDPDTTTKPELASLTGSLVNPASLGVSGPVRIAVLWAGASGTLDVTEDLPVQAVFPTSFNIALDAAPPSSALEPSSAIEGSSGNFQVAFGTVIAYADLNGNGKLDLVGADASSYVDQIVATDEHLGVFYIAGELPMGPNVTLAGGMPVLGYNLYRDCPDTSFGPASAASICPDKPDPAASGACGWEPITSAITLTVSSDPQVDSLMCQSPGGDEATGNEVVVPGRPVSYPSPCDPKLACADDGATYTYETNCQTTSGGICQGSSTSCEEDQYTRPSPVPSDWPCKAD